MPARKRNGPPFDHPVFPVGPIGLAPLVQAVGPGDTSNGDDSIVISSPAGTVNLKKGDDDLTATAFVDRVIAGGGDDEVDLQAGGGFVNLGTGDDKLTFSGPLDSVNGGEGLDTLSVDAEPGSYDIEIVDDLIILHERFTGAETVVRNVETFEFGDEEIDADTLRDQFDPANPVPTLLVGGGTQTVTVNDPDPSVSVVWDRTVQQAVIENDGANGPTIASRAYAMVHTAIYDAWATYDGTAMRVSFDEDGNNGALAAGAVATEANKQKAMSYAAWTILNELFPDQGDLFDTVMEGRYGYQLSDDGSLEAAIGIDAAMDLLALRGADGSNQAGDYADTTGYTPENPDPTVRNDITRWTPESVPIDPEDNTPDQSFLTPHWLEVEGFALPEDGSGDTDFGAVRPVAPQPFFIDSQSGSSLDFDNGMVTLGAAATIGGNPFAAGATVAVTKDLIGPVINPLFIQQAEEVIDFSANLTDEQKIIAEFWEDGGGTAFPPGTFMTFAQLVSARDGHDLDTDVKMFLAMGNAVFDAGIATWEAKVFYDYARPVRVIRDLGELGLIGEDNGSGEFEITAWGGPGQGTQTILATEFITFQRPNGDASPPFAEYTSGHSAFSAAGAEVLRLFTGSDDFGGSIVFPPDSIQFEAGVPAVETTLEWATFTDAADEAGLSRLYGGIHFIEGDLNGRQLGSDTGALAFDLAEAFWTGTATDADRPFWDDPSA